MTGHNEVPDTAADESKREMVDRSMYITMLIEIELDTLARKKQWTLKKC